MVKNKEESGEVEKKGKLAFLDHILVNQAK